MLELDRNTLILSGLFVLGLIAGLCVVFAYIFKGVRKLKESHDEVRVFLDAVLPGEEEKPAPKPPEKKKKKRGSR